MTLRLLLRLSRATPRELAASLWAFVYFFALLAGYYVLRPIRDEMAIQGGQQALSGLFTMVFVTMLVLAPVFGDPQDRIALNKLARLFPDREIVGIPCRDLVLGLGTLHCMTQQQPA